MVESRARRMALKVSPDSPFEVTVDALPDDVGVLDVTVSVDGQLLRRDSALPDRFLVDPGAPRLADPDRGRRAGTPGGAQSVADEITVRVGQGVASTTVVGSVIGPDQAPFAGASVFTSAGGAAMTQADGGFSIPGVTIGSGALVAYATASADGAELRGGPPRHRSLWTASPTWARSSFGSSGCSTPARPRQSNRRVPP